MIYTNMFYIKVVNKFSKNLYINILVDFVLKWYLGVKFGRLHSLTLWLACTISKKLLMGFGGILRAHFWIFGFKMTVFRDVIGGSDFACKSQKVKNLYSGKSRIFFRQPPSPPCRGGCLLFFPQSSKLVFLWRQTSLKAFACLISKVCLTCASL